MSIQNKKEYGTFPMATKDLRTLINQPLEWEQPLLGLREFELRVGNELLLTLEKQGVFKRTYNVRMPEGMWTIRRAAGFWRTDLTVLDAQGSTLANGHRWETNKSELWTVSGNRYQWESMDFWGTQWAWRNLESTLLITYHRNNITIQPAAKDLPDLTLLVVMARYLKLLRDDSHA